MKSSSCFFVLVFCTALLCHGRAFVKGRVIDSLTTLPLKNVHVINMSSQTGTLTDSLGVFKIRGGQKDTLAFQILGYEICIKAISNIRDSCQIIKMKPTSYPIKEVRVGILGNYEQFKQMVLSYDPDKNKIDIPGLEKPKIRPISILEDKEYWRSLEALASPISFFYYNFSKEAKSYHKYHEAKKQQNEQLRTDEKYNRELIKSITKLKSEYEITNFMLYCNFSHEYVIQKSEYEICLMIKKKYDDYLIEKEQSE